MLRYAPEHNWIAYEQALKTNPVLAKMAISGIVYSIGDWIAQVNLFLPLFLLIMFFIFGLAGLSTYFHNSLVFYF